jgi:glycosyltransferase involved in cell wall biosynthesis
MSPQARKEITRLLYICIPAYNEACTIGVLLWRIRRVLQDSPRPYEIIVYDDGSDDATREVLQPYIKVLPLTVIGDKKRLGYAQAVQALLKDVSVRTRYPRRDAMILMQGDFTDQPEHIPELMKRFEGGADIVVAERPADKLDKNGRSLSRLGRWATRPFVNVPNISDPFGTFRLYRISVIRELLKSSGDSPVVSDEGWGANLELLLKAARVSRRTESVSLDPRYDVRIRESRVRPMQDAMRLFRFGWSARKWPQAPVRQ